MEQSYRYTIPDEGTGQRLDKFLGSVVHDISREKIKRAILEGGCRVQGVTVKAPGTRLAPGQEVVLTLHVPTTALEPEEGDVACIWQDAHILVLNKPVGITVHPCPSCPQGTLVQRLAAHFPQLLHQEGLRPGIVHRLDKDTSGLLLVALTEEARLRCSSLFAARGVHKEYLALVRGVPPQQGVCLEPLGRHPTIKVRMAVVPESRGGKSAHTEWRVLYADPAECFSLLAVRIHTGRTHQIRAHMAHMGYPLWGDSVYGPAAGAKASDPAPRQMLHAWKLALPHPVTDEALSFLCPPPADMLNTILSLAKASWRLVLTGLPGCGKTTLLHLLEQRGIPIWSADAVVSKLYAPKGDAHRFLRDRYGERFVLEPSAPVNRPALLAAMEEDPLLRHEVEQTVHAMVRHSLDEFWQRTSDARASLAAAEVPLYLEKGWRADAKGAPLLVVGVACPAPQRYARLAAIRGWSAEKCRTLDSWQWPEERKFKACDMVVDNSDHAEPLAAAADRLLLAVQEREQARLAVLAQDVRKLCAAAQACNEEFPPHGQLLR